MGILQRFKTQVKKYQDGADDRAEKKLAKLTTKTAREREIAKQQRKRLKTKKEISEAKTALVKSETTRKKARKELSDVGGDGFSQVFKNH